MMAEILHFHLFCGLGGGARGFNAGEARVGAFDAEFRCLGGIDVNPGTCRDFEQLAQAPATCLDLFDRQQYRDFHGHEPPEGWREATIDDIRQAAGGERPHILFTSPPCKGFSGLLSQARSSSARYQALNRLTLRGLMLALEAWSDDPPEFVLLENVPRIATRGRRLLDAIEALLEAHGYAVAETTHDCGELGGLAQSRKRFLLVGRHREKVPPFLYEPLRRPLRGVGEVIGAFPMPGTPSAGPMHAIRKLQWRTWVRLAFVEAGGDWRSLERLRVDDGMLADYGIVPESAFGGVLGVTPWDEPACTVTGRGAPTCGAFAVADPRTGYNSEYSQLGVLDWLDPAGAVSGQSQPGGGRYSVADPRLPKNPRRHRNKYRVVRWDRHAGTVIGNVGVGDGAASVADPRLACDAKDRERRRFNNVYRVVRWADVSPAVTGGTGPSAGGVAVADPRPAGKPRNGIYGVVPWDQPAGTVTASAKHDNGPHNVADPRLPAATEQLAAVIFAEDGTWHRPFTTLELASLQGLVDPGEYLELDGSADGAHRERIGNAVPSPTAQAIASVMGRALLLAWSGQTFVLDSAPIWVKPLMVAASVDVGGD
jgi:site-specific DNA-cytosine methylase